MQLKIKQKAILWHNSLCALSDHILIKFCQHMNKHNLRIYIYRIEYIEYTYNRIYIYRIEYIEYIFGLFRLLRLMCLQYTF